MTVSPLYDLAAAFLFLAVVMGTGARFAIMACRDTRGAEFLVLSFAMGSGIISILTFFMCAIGMFGGVSSGIVAGTGIILFLLHEKRIAAATRQVVSSAFSKDRPADARYVALPLCFLFAILSVIPALAPPVELDALAYHLPLAKLYATSGGFVSTPSIVYSHFPLGVHLLFSWLLLVDSAAGASLVHYMFGIFTTLAAALAAERLGGGRGRVGPLAAMFFLATPLVQWEMGVAYVDLAVSFYLLVSFYFIFVADGGGTLRRYAVAGLLAGFAVAAKLSAGPYVLLLVLFCVYFAGGSAKIRIAAGTIFSFACLAPVVPWLFRTFLETGNPVFPFLYSVFGGRNWNQEVNRIFVDWHFMGYGFGRGVVSFLTLPWNLTFHGAEKFGWKVPMAGRELGYLFLAFLPLLVVPVKSIKKYLPAGIFVLAAVVVWFLGTQQLRFMLPFWGMLCVLYAAKTAGIMDANHIAFGAVWVVIIALAGYNMSEYAGGRILPLRALAGGERARVGYVEENVPPFEAFLALDGLASDVPAARAGLLIENRSFYSRTPVVWLTPTQQGVFDYGKIKSSYELAEELQRAGITHILANGEAFARLYLQLDRERRLGRPYSEYFMNFFRLYHALLNSGMVEKQYDDGRFVVFRLK